MEVPNHMSHSVNENVPGGSHSRKTALLMVFILTLLAGMFGFVYANARFFVVLCQKVGLLAESPMAIKGNIEDLPLGREMEIYFSAHVNDGMPIVFSVDRRMQKARLNQKVMNEYRFVNTSNQTLYFQPIHDVYPMQAGSEETMILEQCFCFTQQKLEPFQSYTMPVVYTFTENLEDSTHVIKMTYSLAPSDKQAYETSMKAYREGLVTDSHRDAAAPKP